MFANSEALGMPDPSFTDWVSSTPQSPAPSPPPVQAPGPGWAPQGAPGRSLIDTLLSPFAMYAD